MRITGSHHREIQSSLKYCINYCDSLPVLILVIAKPGGVEGEPGPVVPALEPVEDDGGDAVDGGDEGEEEDDAEDVVLVLVADARLEIRRKWTLRTIIMHAIIRSVAFFNEQVATCEASVLCAK